MNGIPAVLPETGRGRAILAGLLFLIAGFALSPLPFLALIVGGGLLLLIGLSMPVESEGEG